MRDGPSENKLKIIISISLAGGIGILPFSIYRFLQQDWLLSIVDFIISSCMLMLALYVYRSKKINFATHVMLIITLLGLIFIISTKGIDQAYWIYPALAYSYFLLEHKVASLYASFGIVVITPVLYQHATPVTFASIMITLVMTLMFTYIFAAEGYKKQQLLLDLVVKDPLTGAGNRRALSNKIENLIAIFKRAGNKATILLLDIDHFKRINDLYGHRVGDNFLVELTKVLKSRIRVTDSLYRYGGEEFVIVTENTKLDAGLILAEELRATIEKEKLIPETYATLSIGVAELQTDESESIWFNRADDALYKAKKSGRNLVCISGTL